MLSYWKANILSLWVAGWSSLHFLYGHNERWLFRLCIGWELIRRIQDLVLKLYTWVHYTSDLGSSHEQKRDNSNFWMLISSNKRACVFFTCYLCRSPGFGLKLEDETGAKLPEMTGYPTSKLLNVMHARELARRLKGKKWQGTQPLNNSTSSKP